MRPQFDLSGRVALVTGASSGLGRAMADAGCAVVGVARRRPHIDTLVAAIEASGGQASAPGRTRFGLCDRSDLVRRRRFLGPLRSTT